MFLLPVKQQIWRVKNPCYCSKLAQNAFKERMAVVRFTGNVWGKHQNVCCLQKAAMFTQKWSDWRSEEGRAGCSSDVKILIPFHSLPKPPLIRETCEGFWKPVQNGLMAIVAKSDRVKDQVRINSSGALRLVEQVLERLVILSWSLYSRKRGMRTHFLNWKISRIFKVPPGNTLSQCREHVEEGIQHL